MTPTFNKLLAAKYELDTLQAMATGALNTVPCFQPDYFSYDCKGIIGNDGRHYLIDLFRSFAPDVFALGGEYLGYLNELLG